MSDIESDYEEDLPSLEENNWWEDGRWALDRYGRCDTVEDVDLLYRMASNDGARSRHEQVAKIVMYLCLGDYPGKDLNTMCHTVVRHSQIKGD